MTSTYTVRDKRRDLVFDRIVEAGTKGTTKVRLGDALRAARLGTVEDVNQAIFDVRQVLADLTNSDPTDVIVYEKRQRIYRIAVDLEDAETWRRWRLSNISSQLANARKYLGAERFRFGTELATAVWDLAEQSLSRAAEDLDRAFLLTFGEGRP